MVNVGFIVEGDCEKIILDSPAFTSFLSENGLSLVNEIINAGGKSKLKPQAFGMQGAVQILKDQGANWIFVLRDMDDAASITAVKAEVFDTDELILCVAVKELEAWFLADSKAMATMFNIDTFYYDYPELTDNPPETISQLSMKHMGRGTAWDKTGGKIKFANKMKKAGFTIENAARHPNCPSAHYFLTKL